MGIKKDFVIRMNHWDMHKSIVVNRHIFINRLPSEVLFKKKEAKPELLTCVIF